MKSTGYYEELRKLKKSGYEDGYDFLKEEDAGYEDMSVYDFLCGYCATFAYALHKRFGYEIRAIYKKYDYETCLVHCYCVIPKRKKTIYVDVRGCTSDYKLFIDAFRGFVDAEESEPYTVIDGKPKEVSEKYLPVAEELINYYEEYYCK